MVLNKKRKKFIKFWVTTRHPGCCTSLELSTAAYKAEGWNLVYKKQNFVRFYYPAVSLWSG